MSRAIKATGPDSPKKTQSPILGTGFARSPEGRRRTKVKIRSGEKEMEELEQTISFFPLDNELQ